PALVPVKIKQAKKRITRNEFKRNVPDVMYEVNDLGSCFSDNDSDFSRLKNGRRSSEKLIAIGSRIFMYADIQAGCPRVEKILIVGLNASVQHSTSRLPRNKRQVGSLPKCEGSPHNATMRPDMRLIFK